MGLDHVFPVQISSTDKDGMVFQHETIGGLSKLQYISIELFKGMVSNPALIQGDINLLRRQSMVQAEKLLEDFENCTPEKPTLVS
jgi:hypothetical protein